MTIRRREREKRNGSTKLFMRYKMVNIELSSKERAKIAVQYNHIECKFTMPS